MIYGYARVSTDAQELTTQLDQLKAAGCERVFREKISGATADRPQLRQLLAVVAHGDRGDYPRRRSPLTTWGCLARMARRRTSSKLTIRHVIRFDDEVGTASRRRFREPKLHILPRINCRRRCLQPGRSGLARASRKRSGRRGGHRTICSKSYAKRAQCGPMTPCLTSKSEPFRAVGRGPIDLLRAGAAIGPGEKHPSIVSVWLGHPSAYAQCVRGIVIVDHLVRVLTAAFYANEHLDFDL